MEIQTGGYRKCCNLKSWLSKIQNKKSRTIQRIQGLGTLKLYLWNLMHPFSYFSPSPQLRVPPALQSLIDVPPSCSLIFRNFSTQDILIPHPRLLNFRKCSSQDIFKFFCHINFRSNFRSPCIPVSNWIRKEHDCVCCIKTNIKS